MNALILQDPIPIILFARKKHILGHKPFKSLVNFCTGEAPSHLARIFKAKVRTGEPKYKFGVQVPLGIKQAMELDKANGDTLWADAIKKELKQLNDYKTFRLPNSGEILDSGYKRIPYHIVFDVKFDLRRKARLVASGDRTDLIGEDMYSGVVAMETVRVGFFLGELNHLTCCAGDVGNAYLYSKTREKVYIVAGPEFGKELEGKILVIDKALYGLRSSAARFHEHLSVTLIQLGFTPCKNDRNMWMRDLGDHYEYLVTYVDDILVWSKDPMKVMEQLKEIYTMKGVGVPEYYLGGNMNIGYLKVWD